VTRRRDLGARNSVRLSPSLSPSPSPSHRDWWPPRWPGAAAAAGPGPPRATPGPSQRPSSPPLDQVAVLRPVAYYVGLEAWGLMVFARWSRSPPLRLPAAGAGGAGVTTQSRRHRRRPRHGRGPSAGPTHHFFSPSILQLGAIISGYQVILPPPSQWSVVKLEMRVRTLAIFVVLFSRRQGTETECGAGPESNISMIERVESF
jgi:hypothetical protein